MKKLIDLILKQLKRPIAKYFIVAAFIAGLEVCTFAFMNSILKINYLISTTISVTISIILNWYFSKVFVFKTSKYKFHIEFTLVAIASLVGLGIQLAVISISVEYLHLIPVLGKILAIFVTFLWNFWARKKFIFHTTPSEEKAD